MNQTNTPSSINYAILFIICMTSSLVPFTGSALNLALPYINQSLDLDVMTSGWIPTAYILSTAIFQVPFARIADMVGRKKIFLTGVLIFTLFSLLSGLAQSGLSLIIYRFLAGTGSAMMFGTSIAILTASMPAHKRGQVLGINTAVVYASLAAGPLLGGLLTQYLDWQSIFFVSAGIGLIVYIGAWIAIKKEWKEEKKTSFDTIGACLYALGLLALIYGFTELPSTKSLLLILTGILLLTGFAYYEKKTHTSGFQYSSVPFQPGIQIIFYFRTDQLFRHFRHRFYAEPILTICTWIDTPGCRLYSNLPVSRSICCLDRFR